MTLEQLEAQSRAAIKAWCDDPSVQLEFMSKAGSSWITKIDTVGMFCLDQHYYRIAKPRKWYRVALFKGDVITATEPDHEIAFEQKKSFIRWLDERKYYD